MKSSAKGRLPYRVAALREQCLAALSIRIGPNQVVEALSFGEVQLAVFKRAASELTGFGGAHMFERRDCRKQGDKHGAAAMNVKFGDIFSGGTCWPRKPQNQGIVDRLQILRRRHVVVVSVGRLPYVFLLRPIDLPIEQLPSVGTEQHRDALE